MRNHTAKWVALYGMLISLAFIFSYIEAVIPIPIPVPGVKLGLANLVSIVGLYTVGIKGTIAVSLVRIVLVGFTFGNLSSMIYSLAGGRGVLLSAISHGSRCDRGSGDRTAWRSGDCPDPVSSETIVIGKCW